MAERIKLSGADPSPVQTPPGPVTPAPGSGPAAPASAPITMQNTVTEKEAIAASEHTRINTLTGGLTGPGNPIQTGQSVTAGSLIDGKLAVELMDASIPALMVFLLLKTGLKVRKTELQLTEKEKGVLAPIVSKCLETLMINFNNPWAALGVTMLAFYGAKILPAVAEKIEEKGQKKEAAKTAEAVKKNEPVPSVAPPAEVPVVDIRSSVMPWEPTEEMIASKMKQNKCGRKKAIDTLKALHKTKKI